MQQARARVLKYMDIQQHRQKEYYDKGVRGKTYAVNDFVFLFNQAVGRGYSKKFHKPWQGPFKVVEVLGPTVYRIAECANPKRQKVVHFNRLKPAPAEAESQPPPEVILWPCTPRLPTDPAGALPNAGDHNEDIQPPIVPMEPEDRQPEPEDRQPEPEDRQPEPEDRQPEPEDRQPEPEDRQPVIELVPDVPGPRRSTRVRRPTMRYGDPVEIPETIQDEDLFG